eukprot:m.339153 g.339153  ORF g.339153 m.339153 type:complete len:118 (-) comp27812_c0_seq2:153-506(-)
MGKGEGEKRGLGGRDSRSQRVPNVCPVAMLPAISSTAVGLLAVVLCVLVSVPIAIATCSTPSQVTAMYGACNQGTSGSNNYPRLSSINSPSQNLTSLPSSNVGAGCLYSRSSGTIGM